MLHVLPGPVRGVLTLALIAVNTVAWCVPVYALILVKLAVPVPAWRPFLDRILTVCGESWISVNNAVLALTQSTTWDVRGIDGLARQGRFLVNANHQSWADIVVLQRVFNRRIPFLKFFVKQELIWMPILGLAWWGMGFPFVKRYSREQLERHPELRGKDMETTRRMCDRFSGQPVSIINFLEGTRYTPEKHARQDAPYEHLLRPKAGGVAFVLAAVGDTLESMLDVTIVYEGGRPTFWGFLSGNVPRIIVAVREREIPRDLIGGNYMDDPDFRQRIQSWTRSLWMDKDVLIGDLLDEVAA